MPVAQNRRDVLRTFAAGPFALGVLSVPLVPRTNRADGVPSRVEPSPQQVISRATFAHVAITVVAEKGSGFGSGVMIKPSATIAPLLGKNEVLVASASHNANDITDRARVYGTIYNPSKTGASGWVANQPYNVRLIGRFVNIAEKMSIDRSSSESVDVALFAMAVPESHLESARSRALAVSSIPLDGLPARSPVYAVGSRGSTTDEKGIGRSSPPTWRQGIVIDPSTERDLPPVTTQFGPVGRHLIYTTIQNDHGDSGGGLVWVNPRTREIEVVGVCSGGAPNVSTADSGWIDFNLLRVGATQEELDRLGVERVAIARIPEARTPYRGLFAGWESIQKLELAVREEFDGLLATHRRLERHYAEIQAHLADKGGGGSASLREGLNELRSKALGPIERQLRALNPDLALPR